MINIFVIFVITHGVDLTFYSKVLRASLVAQTVKNLPAVQKTWVQSLGWEDPLEKGTATHSSMLAWRIPWTEEPSRLQSLGPQSWTRLSKHSEGTMGSEKDGEEG